MHTPTTMLRRIEIGESRRHFPLGRLLFSRVFDPIFTTANLTPYVLPVRISMDLQ